MLTQKRLKDVLTYHPTTGSLRWAITTGARGGEGTVAGTITSEGYRRIKIDGNTYRAGRLIWLYVNGYMPENPIDHINRVRDDDRLSNLREVSHQCNARNQNSRHDNTSGLKGVYWNKGAGKWHAQIKVNGRVIYLGIHDDLIEAACTRLAAEQAENWEGCDSSSPAYQYVQKMLGATQ